MEHHSTTLGHPTEMKSYDEKPQVNHLEEMETERDEQSVASPKLHLQTWLVVAAISVFNFAQLFK